MILPKQKENQPSEAPEISSKTLEPEVTIEEASIEAPKVELKQESHENRLGERNPSNVQKTSKTQDLANKVASDNVKALDLLREK